MPYKTKEKDLEITLKDLLEKKENKVVSKIKGDSQRESEFLINWLKEIQK